MHLLMENVYYIMREKKKGTTHKRRGTENFRKIAAVCDVERIKKGRG